MWNGLGCHHLNPTLIQLLYHILVCSDTDDDDDDKFAAPGFVLWFYTSFVSALLTIHICYYPCILHKHMDSNIRGKLCFCPSSLPQFCQNLERYIYLLAWKQRMSSLPSEGIALMPNDSFLSLLPLTSQDTNIHSLNFVLYLEEEELSVLSLSTLSLKFV